MTHRVLSDRRLRTRVRLFGELLGTVLREQEHGEVFAAVEELRRGFVSLRKRDSPSTRKRLARCVRALEPALAGHVVRAFSTYFSLVNVAEEAFHHQERRSQVRSGKPLWFASFDHTLRGFHEAGLSAVQVQHLLDGLQYIPVFTAHPTEIKRRTLMESLRRIFILSEAMDDPRKGAAELEDLENGLSAEIQTLWKTDEVRARRPQVKDEIRTGLFYFRESLYIAIPRVYRNLERALDRVYSGGKVRVPSFLRFGSWIGGDRDGNPFVTPATTALALRLQHLDALEEYIRRVHALRGVLTYSLSLCRPSDSLQASLAVAPQLARQVFKDDPEQFAAEPYRRKLALIEHRLKSMRQAARRRIDGAPELPVDGYASAAEFLNDLYLIRDSLISHGDGRIADGELKDLIRLAETLGFHLMTLDVRQSSTRHTQAVTELLAARGVDYPGLDDAGRVTLLAERIGRPNTDPIPENASEPTRETLELFRVVADMQREVGLAAVGEYVISMTHQASHVMEVAYLAYRAGLAGYDSRGWFCYLRFSPLFETIADLEQLTAVITRLFDNPTYRALVAASGGLQEIMLGYSDSCKDGGILSSTFGLYQAQKRIAEMGRKLGIEIRMFHGRGGTMARGGGPTHETILAYPESTVRGRLKFTEQGEVLFYKYNNPETAVYELTVGITGLLKASRCIVQQATFDDTAFSGVMDELAAIGEASYRALVEESPGFIEYFYEVTPVNEIGQLNLGSRPSHRASADRSLDSIRAIPWVFGWAQSRHTLPAWYGLGSALEKYCATHVDGLVRLREMHAQWPYFRSLLGNTQMALFKADMRIAQAYADLSNDPDKAVTLFGKISAEYVRTCEQVLAVTAQSELLEDAPALALSLTRRNPYLDPLNYIQVELLSRYRKTISEGKDAADLLDPLLRSINAIAAGMRNTG